MSCCDGLLEIAETASFVIFQVHVLIRILCSDVQKTRHYFVLSFRGNVLAIAIGPECLVEREKSMIMGLRFEWVELPRP